MLKNLQMSSIRSRVSSPQCWESVRVARPPSLEPESSWTRSGCQQVRRVRLVKKVKWGLSAASVYVFPVFCQRRLSCERRQRRGINQTCQISAKGALKKTPRWGYEPFLWVWAFRAGGTFTRAPGIQADRPMWTSIPSHCLDVFPNPTNNQITIMRGVSDWSRFRISCVVFFVFGHNDTTQRAC